MVTDSNGAPKASVWTIRRRLRSFGLFARRPRKKPLLSRANKKARLAWAKAHQDWGMKEWSQVLWTDESPFPLFPGREGWVRRRLGTEKCLAPTVKHGGGSIMVWGCFHASGVGVLNRLRALSMEKHTGKYSFIMQFQS